MQKTTRLVRDTPINFKTLFQKILLCGLVLFSQTGKAQLFGVYTVPGSFTSVAAAINSLNIAGVVGPVIVNIAAGYTETAPFGGLQLNSIAGSSSFNTIVFRKSGAGVNPLITANSGGSGTPASATVQDGIWRLVGSDFVTIDGIDLLDPNVSNPSTMEYGYGLFKASGTNGCQNNTIKNCTVTLNRINAASASGSSAGGSKGIYMSGCTTSFYTQAVNTTSFIGTNSGNSFIANKIQNCHTGISLTGYNNQGFQPYCDQFNSVGGLTASSGNTVVNFGGGLGTTGCYGIDASYQYSLTILSNVINNNDGAGLDPASDLTAIRTLFHSSADLSINNNTITLSAFPNNTQLVLGISNVTSFTLGFINAATININNNIFPFYSSGNSSSSFISQQGLIASSSFPSITNINNNEINNVTTGILPNLIVCSRASTCNIVSNKISNVTFTQPTACEVLRSDAAKFIFDGNVVSSVAVNNIAGGNLTGIAGGFYSNNMAVTNNSLSNIMSNRLNGVYLINNTGSINYTVSSNDLSNFSSTPGATAGIGIYGILLINNSGFVNANVQDNKIFSFNCLAAQSSTASGAAIGGIYFYNISNGAVSRNKIHSFFSDRYNTDVFGISLNSQSAGGYFSTVQNNLIGNFEASNTNNTITGIVLNAKDNFVSFNTVLLSGNNTGANTNSRGLFLNSTISTLTTSIRNNIIVNTLPATGTGTASAMTIFSLTMYGSSDRNILYAGVPAANRLIAKVGALNYSTINTFKSAVAPREALTFTENPAFASTLGTSSNYLNLNPTVITLAEGGATPISGITNDYAGTTRNTLNPDIGAWEGNFTGFDRAAPLILSSGFTTLPCGNFTTRTFTLALMDTSGVAGGALAPRLYYRVNNGIYISVQGTLSTGTATNGVWTFNLTYNTVAGATISYFVVLQDQSTFNNLTTFPFGGIATSVNAIQTPPNPPGSYVLQNYPTIAVNSGSICTGKVFTMFASGASSYTYSSGSSTVNPLVTTSYSVTGQSSSGCPATNTVVSTVVVVITPTISATGAIICAGQSHTFTPSGANTYVYSGGSAVVSPPVTRAYTITGNSSGCTSSIVVTIVVQAIPDLDFISVEPPEICNGGSSLLGIGGAIVTCTWLPNGGNTFFTSVSPSVTTTYTMIAFASNGCSITDQVVVIVNACTGIAENELNAAVKIYPVPSNGAVFLELLSPAVLKIYNNIGRLVYNEKKSPATHTIDLSAFPKGVYVLDLNFFPSGSKRFKIVVE